MTLTGRNRRLSLSVARLGQESASAVLVRPHSASDRDGGVPLGTLILDGVHALGATSLLLQAPDSGPLTGKLPIGTTLTIAAADYVVAADAIAVKGTNRITATVSPGLAAEAADEAVATLASPTQSVAAVNLRPADERDRVFQQSFGREVTQAGSFPGHLLTYWIEEGDLVVYTRKDGRSPVRGRIEAVQDSGWGQVAFS